jgi:hypothetical protein
MRTLSAFIAAFLVLSASAWADSGKNPGKHEKQCCPQIHVDKYFFDGEAVRGGHSGFTIRVFNAANCDAHGLRLEDLLPQDLFALTTAETPTFSASAAPAPSPVICHFSSNNREIVCPDFDVDARSFVDVTFLGTVSSQARIGFNSNHVCVIDRDGNHFCDDAGILIHRNSPGEEPEYEN